MDRKALIWGVILSFGVLGAFSAAYADHRKSSRHGILEDLTEHVSPERQGDHGHEATGHAAACLFAVGNIPVAGTLVLRRLVLRKITAESKKRAGEWYAWLKKDLMPFHYVLNAIAILTALIHLKLSWCRSTPLPEWALLLVFLVALMGFLMKFRLLPRPLLRPVRWLHTNPLLVAAVFGLLFLGHQYLD